MLFVCGSALPAAVGAEGYPLKEKVLTDSVSGRKIHLVGIGSGHTLHGYVTSHDWTNDGKKAVVYVQNAATVDNAEYSESIFLKGDESEHEFAVTTEMGTVKLFAKVVGDYVHLEKSDFPEGVVTAASFSDGVLCDAVTVGGDECRLKIFEGKCELKFFFFDTLRDIRPIAEVETATVYNGAMTSEPYHGLCDIVLWDTESGTAEFVAQANGMYIGTVENNRLFFRGRDGYIHMNELENGKDTLLWDYSLLTPLSATRDGKFVVGSSNSQKGLYRKIEVDTKTVTTGNVLSSFSAEPNCIAHPIVSPVNPNHLGFTHDSNEVDDVVWFYDASAGSGKALYRHKTQNGVNMEFIGHMCWAHDGSGFYVVKYPNSRDNSFSEGKTGIGFIPTDGIDEGEPLNIVANDKKYQHVSASEDGKYLVADAFDTSGGNAEIVLIDLETKQSEVLCSFANGGSSMTTAHPHPTFSRDGKKVSFNMVSEGRVYMAYIDLEEK